MKIKIKKLIPEAVIPFKGSKHAACFDLVATSYEYDEKNNNHIYGLGFATEFKPKYKAVIVPRSSFTGLNLIMQNSPAQIDADFRGQWIIKFMGKADDIVYSIGDKIAQCYFEKVISSKFNEVKTLNNTERGTGSYGSTGITHQAKELMKNK